MTHAKIQSTEEGEILRQKAGEAVRAYAQHRTTQLLAENAYNIPELRAIIHAELCSHVSMGVADVTVNLLQTDQIKPDRNMRITTKK